MITFAYRHTVQLHIPAIAIVSAIGNVCVHRFQCNYFRFLYMLDCASKIGIIDIPECVLDTLADSRQ